MTAVSVVRSTPPVLASYLCRATWGLPKARQQELWDELEEHVLERADHLCAFGTPYKLALRQAVSELGPPARVSAGMSEVYLMPNMIRVGLVVAVAGVLTALGLGGSQLLTLPVLSERPVTPSCAKGTRPSGPMITIVSEKNGITCYTFNMPSVYEGSYISVTDLKRAFEAAHLQFNPRSDGGLSVRYPNGEQREIGVEFSKNGQSYVDADSLIVSTARHPVTSTLSIKGYDNPTIDFGEYRLQVGATSAPAKGNFFYSDLAPTLVGLLITPRLADGWNSTVSLAERRILPAEALALPRHVVRTKLKPGAVVMLVTKWKHSSYATDIAPVNQDGTVTLMDPHKSLRFVSNPVTMAQVAADIQSEAVLVKVSDTPLRNLKTGIFLPSQISSDAR